MEEASIRSKTIKITPQNFVARILQQWLKRYGWMLVIPMSICGAMAVNRWEWLLAGILLMLPVFPMLLALVYFIYGTKPENLKFILPMRVCIDNEAVSLEYENGQTEVIEYQNIKDVSLYGKETVINLFAPKYASIVVRDNQWEAESPEKAKQIITAIFTKNGMTFV